MWETFISWYINNYLGKYVENLNSEQLSFALRQGELELENVPLKKNIFRSWGLPIEVRSGVVGRIKIQFNLLNYFRNEPVLISIEDIYLVAVPLDLSEWDPVEEEGLAHEAKMSSLDSHEGRWRAQFDIASNSSSYYSSLYFSSMQIGASIVTKLVENVQLNVRNVHIRFEEPSGSSQTMAFGVKLKNLSACSCDSKWNPLSTSATGNQSDCSFKTLQLTEFSIYCDIKTEKLSQLSPLKLINGMNKLSSHHGYLLCPVSAEARISKNNSSQPLSSSSKPRFELELFLNKVPFELTDSQYRGIRRSYNSFRRLHRNCRLRHYRPFSQTVKEAPILWWKYAARAILASRGYKQRTVLKDLDHVLQRARDNVGFVDAYVKHLRQELLSMDLRKLKDRMETQLHFDDIVSLREVAMRRVEKGNEIPKEVTVTVPLDTTEQISTVPSGGAFSNLFPSWSSWLYSSQSTSDLESRDHDVSRDSIYEDFEHEILQLRKSESELDESILDDVKSFGKDSLLARFKFVLKKGVVALNRRTGPFLQLDFRNVEIQTELRPRSGSHKFQMTLASLSLRDCSTKSVLVSPHQVAGNPPIIKPEEKKVTDPIFTLTYERKPRKRIGHRVTLTTKPLDIVIFPVLWNEISTFFISNEIQDYLELQENGYELMKQKTKEEIRIRWERFLNFHKIENLTNGFGSVWEVNLDVSAPQIVIHGTEVSFDTKGVEKKTQKFLVFDLGRFRFTNMEENSQFSESNPSESETREEEEEFLTPCSSPVGERVGSGEESDSNSSRPSITKEEQNGTSHGFDFTECLDELQAKLYKKYKLEITDIQVIVVEGKSLQDGSWKVANARPTSLLHLVDRFSINLQLERRLVWSEDPDWPALTILATLPKLNLHINESKILCVRSVLNSYLEVNDSTADAQSISATSLSGSQLNLTEVSFLSGRSKSGSRNRNADSQGGSVESNNLRLFLAEFTIQTISVEIQSRGRSVAELQITGARTTLTKRSSDTSISFVIQSLLLADAIQTYGPDFELLLASHKHVSMDSVSGSLIDSDPTSPMSPQSPSSPLPFQQGRVSQSQKSQLAIPKELHDAILSSLLRKENKRMSNQHGYQSPTYDTEALITAEVVFITNDDSDGTAVISVSFNNLDIIANQETVVEILGFLQEIIPSSTEERRDGKIRNESGSGRLLGRDGKWKIEGSFDFNRINVLLLRGVLGKDGSQSGRKIATATACDARVGFSLGDGSLRIEGCLGGLQMLNLTPEGQYHSRMLSVGKDPLIDIPYNVFNPTSKTCQSSVAGIEIASALEFTFEKLTMTHATTPVFTMRMASVIYTHCPTFLIDLKKCIDQFQVPFGSKLKSAAAQIALGLIRQESLQGMNSGGSRSPFGSLSVSLDKLNSESVYRIGGASVPSETVGIKLDIVLDSPVIALPRSRTSSEVLVGNLGQITISSNGDKDEGRGEKFSPVPSYLGENGRENCSRNSSATGVTYSVLIRDISLYSLDLKDRWDMIRNLKMTYPASNRMALMRAEELYFCDTNLAKPILHNTVLQFNIEYIPEAPFLNAEYNPMSLEDEDEESMSAKVGIQGRVVNPLKVSLTPAQYAQVLASLNNVAAGEEDFLLTELKVESVERRKVRWANEMSKKISTATVAPLPSPTKVGEDSLSISATFEVPELIVELVLNEDCSEMSPRNKISNESPQLSLSCAELSFECERKGFVTEMKVNLKSLRLEDTHAPKDSIHRLVAMSHTSNVDDRTCDVNLMNTVFQRTPNISTSCPDLALPPPSGPIPVPSEENLETFSYFSPNSCARTESSSLPDHLNPNDIFSARFYQACVSQKSIGKKLGVHSKRIHKQGRKFDNGEYNRGTPSEDFIITDPATPPPSPRSIRKLENLVQIQITLVDSKSPNFLRKYHGIHKYTDIDFNTVEVVLTPSTFSCLRRFFRDASTYEQIPKSTVRESNSAHKSEQRRKGRKAEILNSEDQERNTEMVINVKALRVKFAHLMGSVAEAEVTEVMCHFVNQGNDFYGVDGRLGSLQVKDVSPHSGKYPVKFVFQGKQALNFDYCCKDNEAKFRLEMASALCIHTHRFYTEFLNLWSSIFGSSEPSDTSETSNSNFDTSATEKTRVILNIQAGAPVLFFPYCSTSTSLLVADFGHLSVRNKFLEESNGRPSFDYISVDLLEMDLYSAELGDGTGYYETRDDEFKSWVFDETMRIWKTSSSSSLLRNKCALNLKVKRLLSKGKEETRNEAALSIHGTLSTVYAKLNLDKYQLIRGLLLFNIGEQIESNPSSSPVKQRYPLVGSSTGTSSRLELTIELDLLNVTVEILKKDNEPLSRVDFLKSKFTFQNFSDETRDIDLASQEILISDIRTGLSSEGSTVKNVFTNILQQSMTVETTSKNSHASEDTAGSSSFKSSTKLRAEVHLRETQRKTNLTILLNNMRLMLILDWWMEVQSFLSEGLVDPSPVLLIGEKLTEIDESDKQLRNISPLLSRTRDLRSPITVSAGIVTKRAPVLDVPEKTFELKLNVSDCELVVVEDPTVWDTNAVILKITAALTYRPHLERPISCTIIESELFSCVLGIESETALSILDPTSVTIEVVRKTTVEPQGILDATLSPSSTDKILKIKTTQICLRFSYYDMRMFLKLLERFSKQVQAHFISSPGQHQWSPSSSLNSGGSSEELTIASLPSKELYYQNLDEEALHQLVSMGFGIDESCRALEWNEGRVEDAAILLTSPPDDFYSFPTSAKKRRNVEREVLTAKKSESADISVISCIEIKISHLSLCVIDDCKDADVPLAELNVNGLDVVQDRTERLTTAEAVLSGDFYNRELCGWEPFLEPWKCTLRVQQNEIGQLGKRSPSSEFPSKAPQLDVSITSHQLLNVNLTSTLLELYKTVSSNWSDAYSNHQLDKRRLPFVPFALKNDTGSPLWFSTIISNHQELISQKLSKGKNPDGTRWIQVSNGATQTFSFEGRGKLRHRNTHQLKTHQLVVRVNGWYDSNPVSVDRVGVYFRDVRPMSNIHMRSGGETTELPSTRLVFEVSLLGSAQKLVRIRSALMVKNLLQQTMELKLENTIIYPAFEMAQTGGSYCLHVKPQETYPIPLHSISAQIWLRPIVPGTQSQQTVYSYCAKPLLVGRDSDRTCGSFATNQIQPYRFCVAIKRDEFPADTDDPKPCTTTAQLVALGMVNRANLITLISPLTIINLLPYEVAFEMKAGNFQVGRISAGKKFFVTNVDTTENVEIGLSTDILPQGTSVTVSTASTPFVARLKLMDMNKRVLYINARVSRGEGGTITIRIVSQYWIINKSGLPIVIKQDGANAEAAGQFEEHENGRMMEPLLFSFCETEVGSNISLRVGTGLHPPPARPHWCRSFPLQNGTRVRKLTVSLSHFQPEVVYLVGMEVTDGKGRYRDSKLVIITPRFIIENRSSHRMQISQRNFASSFLDPGAEATHYTLTPKCTLPFHWPRLDKDQLLCVRLLDVSGCVWSGGFPIENVLSFHINLRDLDGSCYFLRVETVMEGPTYFVVFSDTDQLPPPFRIDNLSFVPIIFHQTNVGDERLKLVAKSESSFAYAWDEPTLPSNMTLAAPGGTSAIANMSGSSLGLVAHITYENFFYIALTATFPRDDGEGLGQTGMETLQLVLDVPEGSKVVLSRKETGNRNQLWRVNGDGLVEHEGSSPPRDPRKPYPSPSLVLDIAGQATQPTQCVHLMLRKPDKRRAVTQHWEFTHDGRLKCRSLSNMFVQAKDGFGSSNDVRKGSFLTQRNQVAAWQMWNDVVLGPPQPICYVRTDSGIPAEQALARQKLRPGSGRLSVYVDTDGPTRILRIIDSARPPRSLRLNHTFEENSINCIPNMVLNLNLVGLGLSIISSTPREELIYALFSKVAINWIDTKESESVSVSVEHLQVDNQLLECEKCVALYVTPPARHEIDESRQVPVLCCRWKRLKSPLNAHLFKEFELSIRPLNVIFEEKLLLKLCNWLGLGLPVPNVEEGEDGIDITKALTNSTSLTTKRFYFGQLRILLSTVRLSVLPSSKLPTELNRIKQQLGLTLIRFEETLVELDPFLKEHPFETFDFLVASILKHYKDELLSQALLVLGSVDFLGNPVGFVNDVSVGVSSLIHDGSVGGLLKNVTHGLSNSAAKVTGSLGDGLTRTLTTLDEKHEEQRRRIRDEGSLAVDPFIAGWKGFYFGVLGGVASIFTQTYEGVVNDGLPGLVSGLGKGIVGTVTKPAVGMLDLAAGAATAIRYSSRTSARMIPKRNRLTRLVTGHGGLLPPFSEATAKGQELMYEIHGRDQSLLFIGYETLCVGPDNIRILISSDRITVFTHKPRGILLDIPLRELMECRLVEVAERGLQPITPTATYSLQKQLVIEFTRVTGSTLGVMRPQVLVDKEQVGKAVVQQVHYAQILFEEMRHSQINTSTSVIDD